MSVSPPLSYHFSEETCRGLTVVYLSVSLLTVERQLPAELHCSEDSCVLPTDGNGWIDKTFILQRHAMLIMIVRSSLLLLLFSSLRDVVLGGLTFRAERQLPLACTERVAPLSPPRLVCTSAERFPGRAAQGPVEQVVHCRTRELQDHHQRRPGRPPTARVRLSPPSPSSFTHQCLI